MSRPPHLQQYGQPIYRPPMARRRPPAGPAGAMLRSAPPPWFSFPQRRRPIVIREPEEEPDANTPERNEDGPLPHDTPTEEWQLHSARLGEWQTFFSTYDKDTPPKFGELLPIPHDPASPKPIAQQLDGDNQQINPFIQSYTREQLMDIGKSKDGSSTRIGVVATIKILIWVTDLETQQANTTQITELR